MYCASCKGFLIINFPQMIIVKDNGNIIAEMDLVPRKHRVFQSIVLRFCVCGGGAVNSIILVFT